MKAIRHALAFCAILAALAAVIAVPITLHRAFRQERAAPATPLAAAEANLREDYARRAAELDRGDTPEIRSERRENYEAYRQGVIALYEQEGREAPFWTTRQAPGE